jgi:hypothetical protein
MAEQKNKSPKDMAEKKMKEVKKKEKQASKKVDKKNSKIDELKLEILKQPQKRKAIKKEIARILTKQNMESSKEKNK